MKSPEAEFPRRDPMPEGLLGTAALSSAGLGTWCWNAAADSLSCDRECLRLLQAAGPSPDNLDALIRLVHAADRNPLRVALREVARTGAASAVSFRTGGGGEVRWLHCLLSVRPGTAGSADSLLVGVLGLASPSAQDSASVTRHDLQRVLQSAPVASAKFDRALQLVFANERFIESLRLERFDWQGRTIYDALPEIPAAWREAIERCLVGADIQIDVTGFERADGSQDHVEGHIYPWYGEDNQVGGVLLLADVKPTAADASLTLVADQAPVGIAVASPRGEVRYANAAWLGLCGRGRADVVGADVLAPIHVDDRATTMLEGERGTAGGTRQRDVRMVLPSGEVRWVELLSRRTHDALGEADGFLYAALDITGRARQQRERERSHTVRTLQHGLYEVLFELHAEAQRWARSPSRAVAGDLAQRSQAAVEQLRHVLFELTPPGVAELGFAGAMQRFCADYGAHCNLPIELAMPPCPLRLEEPVLETLYRVARETVAEAAQRPGTTHIKVQVEESASAVRLRIEDNGRVDPAGPASLPGSSSGLLSASLRLRDFGGALRGFSVDGAATIVEVSVPLRPASSGE